MFDEFRHDPWHQFCSSSGTEVPSVNNQSQRAIFRSALLGAVLRGPGGGWQFQAYGLLDRATYSGGQKDVSKFGPGEA